MLNTLKYVLCTNPHSNQRENIYEHWLTNDDFSRMTGMPAWLAAEKGTISSARHSALAALIPMRNTGNLSLEIQLGLYFTGTAAGQMQAKHFFPHTEHLHSVAAHGGGTSEAPSLLVGHHEQRGQALLHQPGKALVVQPQQSNVHPLDHCGNTEKTQISTSCTHRWSNTWSVGQFGTGRCRLTWKLNTWTLVSPLSNSLWG